MGKQKKEHKKEGCQSCGPGSNAVRRKGKTKKGWLRVALHYILLWPALRNYVMLWFKYKPNKERAENKSKKEKVVIIED